ncbi:unnamed protein product [Fusarium graminearum]|nr:unnamed protein product [Fusarium graminearum]
MSDGDSEVDFFDLTDDDNRLESDDETLPPLELTLMLDEDGQGYTGWRQLFLTKRAELQNCKRVNKKKVTRLNREIRAMKEAIHEFYAVHTENNAKNARLAEENRALRALLSDEDLANFPEPKPQDLEDIVACLPERVLTKLPDDIQEYLTKGPRHVLPAPKLRKTEREWPAVAEEFLETGPNAVYQDWGDVYKLSCREENMSWAFGESRAPKTHPYLKLVPPTSSQEQSAIAGVSDCCTPPPIPRDCDSSSSDEEQGFQPFRFQDLPRKIQLKIFRWVLVFEGEAIHAISRLDPYYEPGSMHLNCNRQVSLLHRFHVGREPVSLTFGGIHPQRLLAPLLVCKKWNTMGSHVFYGINTFTIAVHIPESSKSYMRRKHEPPKIIEYLEEITRDQPNYRLFRELRSLQGLDYVCCLRGLREVTFWDYDRWLNEEAKMPVRDWTFVRDINDCVRREKSHNNEHFSQIRYLAPVMKGCRPSIALAARLEAFVNPPPRPAGLLTLSPDGELLYPQPQASVNHLIVLYDSDDEDHPDTDDTGEAEASSNEGSGDEGSESPRPMFVQKLETPSSPGASSHTEGTPARAKREESSLFVGSPLHGGRDSPIDMTQDADMPSPEGQNKRSFASYSTVDENDECLYMGSSPKRAKTEEDDGVDGGSGSGNAANASSGPFIINDDD